MEDFIRTLEAAKFLCVSMSKMTKMCHKKEVPYYKVGRLNLFKKEDLIKYIESNRILTVKELKNTAEERLQSVLC